MLTQIHTLIRTRLPTSVVSRGVLVGVLICLALRPVAQDAGMDLPDYGQLHPRRRARDRHLQPARPSGHHAEDALLLEATGSDAGVRRLALAEAVLGYDDLSKVDSDIIGALLPDQLVTLTSAGVEFIYPVNENWYIKPAELGAGHDFNNDETFALSQLGVRSLSPFELGENWQLAWGPPAGLGSTSSIQESNSFGIIDLGVDVRHSLPWKLFDQRCLGAYYIYQQYLRVGRR